MLCLSCLFGSGVDESMLPRCDSCQTDLQSCSCCDFIDTDCELMICSVRLGVKPYACSMCDRRFFQRYHLQRHSLTHTGMGRLSLPLALLQLATQMCNSALLPTCSKSSRRRFLSRRTTRMSFCRSLCSKDCSPPPISLVWHLNRHHPLWSATPIPPASTRQKPDWHSWQQCKWVSVPCASFVCSTAPSMVWLQQTRVWTWWLVHWGSVVLIAAVSLFTEA